MVSSDSQPGLGFQTWLTGFKEPKVSQVSITSAPAAPWMDSWIHAGDASISRNKCLSEEVTLFQINIVKMLICTF